MSQETAGKEKVPAIAQVKQMGSMFWIANGSEALERLAFFGVRAVFRCICSEMTRCYICR